MMIVHIFVHTRECDCRIQVGVEPILSYKALFWCVFIVTTSAVVVISSLFLTSFTTSVSLTLLASDFGVRKIHTACT